MSFLGSSPRGVRHGVACVSQPLLLWLLQLSSRHKVSAEVVALTPPSNGGTKPQSPSYTPSYAVALKQPVALKQGRLTGRAKAAGMLGKKEHETA